MDLFHTLKSAKKEYKVVASKAKKIKKEMDSELEKATRSIKEKYEPIFIELDKELSEKSGNFVDIAREYHDYGCFFARDITEIFAVFLTYIEGEKYIVYRNTNNHELTEGSIIIKEEVNKQYDIIDYDTLDVLYENGDLIRLNDGWATKIDFYDYFGEPRYFFGQYYYLREFLNKLIQYRIENGKRNSSDITMDELFLFMCYFISTHPDLVQKNKDKREQMLMGQDNVIVGCKKIEKKLQDFVC